MVVIEEEGGAPKGRKNVRGEDRPRWELDMMRDLIEGLV